MSLSTEEKIRYSRHLNLPNFGLETQEKLKASSVLVVGAGGLGAPLLQYLTAAGIGTIGIVDFDVVDTSNLQRQVLFGTSDLGKKKVEAAIARLSSQNPHVNFVGLDQKLTSANALDIISQYDVVADGTDNFPTRYLVNDACVLTGKVNVYASIFQFEGQVSVFNYPEKDGRGPNYRDLFPDPPPPGMVPSCAEGGVLGVLPGIVGAMQGLEVIKVLTGVGSPLSGKLILYDALDFTARKVNIRKDPKNPLTGANPSITELIDYEAFCGLSPSTSEVREITIEDFHSMRKQEESYTLIDVREPYEYDAANLDGILIPVGNLVNHLDQIPTEGKVIVHCRSGARSARAIQILQERHGYTNLYNLKGGIMAWKEQIAPDMTVI